MAGEEGKKTYPRLPASNWWALRVRFGKSLPAKVDASYLQDVLGLGSEKSAQNLLPQFRILGLIDEGGKPTDLATQWRTDEHYAEVCEQIRQSVYPQGILDAFPAPEPDLNRLASRFANDTKTGSGAGQQMAALYGLLSAADLSAQAKPKPDNGSTKPTQATRKPKAETSKSTTKAPQASAVADQQQAPIVMSTGTPSVAINIQLQIAATENAEVYDKFFAAMKKHLFPSNGG